MNRRLVAATTAVFAAVAAALSASSPARAADAPITDIGIAQGTVVNGPVVLRPTVAGGADVRAIRLKAVAGSFWDMSQRDAAAPWELRWDPLNFRDQNVTLSLIAIDSAGNATETAPVTVYVDRWGPAYQIQNLIEDPAVPGWGWHVSVRRPIRISASDPAGLNRVELLQNGRLVRSVALGDKTSGKASLALDPATRNGSSTLTIRLVDRFGNVAGNDFTVTVDNDPPTGVFLPSGGYLRGTFTAWPSDAWDNTYVRSMASYLDDHRGGGATDRYPLGVRVNSRAVRDGRHSLFFELTDLAGNTGVVRRVVIVDNTVPSVALAGAPKNKARLTRKVTLTAKAGDRYGVAKVQLLVNGRVVATDAKAGYQFTLNPRKYGKKFTVRVRAYDKAGNMRYSATRTYRR